MNTNYDDLNSKTLSCFICGKWVESTDYPILPGELENSQTSVLPRISQIIGKAFVALISEKDFLCQKCGALMDLMNDLESKLDNVKSTLAELLNRKFKDILNAAKEFGGSCTDNETCNPKKNKDKQCETSQDKFCAPKFSKEVPLKEDCVAMAEEDNSTSSPNSRKYCCKLCSFSTDFVDQLNVHISSQHKEYKCSICHKIFICLENAYTHIKEIHLAKWTCQFCDKIFPSKIHYIKHTKLHLKGISEESLNQLEKEKVNLSENLREEHGENYISKIKSKNYECSFCEFITYSKNLFDDHIRSHVILKLFKCEECDLLFESKALMNEHQKTHKKVFYKCGMCECTFQSKEYVIRHINDKHKQLQAIEKQNPRPYRRRKQIYNNLLYDLNFNGEIAKSSTVDPQDSTKDNDFTRCDVSSSVMPNHSELDLVHKENQDVELYKFDGKSDDFISCELHSNTEEEKENTGDCSNCSRVNTSESLAEKVQGSLEKPFFEMSPACHIKECQSKILETSNKQLFEPVKEDGISSKEKNWSNSSGYQKQKNVIYQSEPLPAFKSTVDAESMNNELQVSDIVTTGNVYSEDSSNSLNLHSCTESTSIDAPLTKCSDVNLKSVKIKSIGFKEASKSGVKVTEEHVDSEGEREPFWVSFNDIATLENMNCVTQGNQITEHTKPSKIFICGKCGYKSFTALGLKEHFISHVTSKLNECQLDEETLISALKCSQHTSGSVLEKKTRNKLKYSYCTQESSDELQLHNHINECHLNEKTNYTCRFCRNKYMTKLQLISHEESHSQGKIYRCEVCNKGFSRENILSKHRHMAHSSGKCCFCTKTFLNADDLAKHKSKHDHMDGFQCLECPRIFKTKTGLKFHSAQHTGEFKFRCQYCDQGFMSRVVYQEHMGKHTKEERYVCDVCGRKFCFQSTYWIHRKWHDTPFPYKCDVCNRPFRHSSLLKVHKRQHTGERPYNCPHCSRSFSVSGTLKRHLMLHTGEYAFNCGECEKGFTTRNKFALHLSRIHGNNSMLQPGPPKTEFKMVIRETPECPKRTEEAGKKTEGTNQEGILVENYEELDSMMVQDGGIVGDGAELLKESSLMLPCAILDDVGGSLETRIVEILVNDETSQAVATVTVEGNSSLVSW